MTQEEKSDVPEVRGREIMERLRKEAASIEHQVRGQDPGDWKEIALMRSAADFIESSLRSSALAIMAADIATGKATRRSLGVMYGFVMAGASCAGPDFWGPINRMIKAYGEKAGARDQFAFLSGVKAIAWSIFEEAARSASPATKGTAPAVEPKS